MNKRKPCRARPDFVYNPAKSSDFAALSRRACSSAVDVHGSHCASDTQVGSYYVYFI